MDTYDRAFGILNRRTFDDVERIFKIVASVAAVAGLFFAGQQLSLATENSKRQTTLEILRPTHDAPFVAAFRRLQVARAMGKPFSELITEQLSIDSDLLLNTYDIIAVHYKFDTIDRCLTKTYIFDAVNVALPTFEFTQVPPPVYERILQLRNQLKSLNCDHT